MASPPQWEGVPTLRSQKSQDYDFHGDSGHNHVFLESTASASVFSVRASSSSQPFSSASGSHCVSVLSAKRSASFGSCSVSRTQKEEATARPIPGQLRVWQLYSLRPFRTHKYSF